MSPDIRPSCTDGLTTSAIPTKPIRIAASQRSAHPDCALRPPRQPSVILSPLLLCHPQVARGFHHRALLPPPEQIVFHNAVGRAHPILPSDLLAFLISAAVVRYSDLVHLQIAPVRDLGGNFRLKSEPRLLNLDRLYHLPPERLVARLHIGQVEIGQHVGKQRQRAVTDAVPE